MKGNSQVIERLNQVLTNELTAINQYFVHAKMCADWGYSKLAATMRTESIDEMKHAEQIIDRILFLDGIPNLQRLGKVNVGETVPEQLAADLDLEMHAVKYLNESIVACREVNDNATLELVRAILISEEAHIDWIETQQHRIKTMGLENYLTSQA